MQIGKHFVNLDFAKDLTLAEFKQHYQHIGGDLNYVLNKINETGFRFREEAEKIQPIKYPEKKRGKGRDTSIEQDGSTMEGG